MKIFAGLGNPGREYAQTKHNVGFMLLDALAAKLGIASWREDFESLIATTNIGGEKILLVKPQTYMNESGRAIAPLMNYYKVDIADLTVAYDDMDLPAGSIRIRKQGSSGGHNGMKSIIAHLGTEKVARIRIGVGRPAVGWTVINHVLAPFSAEDAQKVGEALEQLVPASLCLMEDGVDLAMNRYNPVKK